MRKLVLLLVAVAALGGAAIVLRAQDVAQDAKFCEMMESQDNFDGETVDMFWHWKREGRPSERFQRLYEAKIRDLPGWRP